MKDTIEVYINKSCVALCCFVMWFAMTRWLWWMVFGKLNGVKLVHEIFK
jgi:hypothetical protein